MKKPVLAAAAAPIAALLLVGCAVGPNYVPPETLAPAIWQNAPAARVEVAQTTPQDLTDWWRQLADPTLTGLIEQALQGNLDLHTAEAKLREARARRALAGAELWPTVSGSAQGQRVKASGESSNGGMANLFTTGFDASWEPDVFGGKQRGVEAAQADLEASQANLHAVQVSLVAEVGLNYVEWRAAQAAIAIAAANADSQAETLELTEWRAQAGLTTALDVEQARANLEQTRAQIPSLETTRTEAEHRLEILLGQQPGTLAATLATPGGIPRIPQQVTIGIPADALRQRPDVRAAERNLAAATARIGVAKAQLFPALSISGNIDTNAARAGSLFDTITGGLFAGISQAIFNGGRLNAQVRSSRAAADGAFAAYKSAVLTALEDIENAIVALQTAQAREREFAIAYDASSNSALLARSQYRSGLTDFTTLNTQEAALISARNGLVQARSDKATALIALYGALGGGWDASVTPTASGANVTPISGQN